MKKGFLILFTIPILLYAGEVRKEYNFSTPMIRNGVVYLDGCRTSRGAFAPSIAVKPVKLLLPYGQKAVSLKVTYDKPIILEGEYTIKPFRPGGKISVGSMKDYANHISTDYDKNEFYPSSVKSENFSTQFKNGHAIFIGTINPVQYNSVSRTLRYHRKITVTVRTESSYAQVYKCTPFIKNQIASLVDNPEAVSSLSLTNRGADDYEYLIVTSDALKNSFNSFIEFNKRRCLRTKIQTIEYITTNITGADAADKVRNYIKQEYTNHNIVFVMLGGDAPGVIPARLLYSKFYDHNHTPDRLHEETPAADMYFGTLDGTWNDDNDSKFGEPGEEDMFWEVFASRFPADNTTDLSNVINKTIKYSEIPVASQVNNCLLSGEFLWQFAGTDIWGADYVEQFLNTCNSNSYSTQGIPTAHWSIDSLYDRTTGANGWSYSDFTAKFNSFKPTWINFNGLGNMSISVGMSSVWVNNSNFQNNGSNANYFLLIAHSAHGCYFDHTTTDCILEKFVNIENGAVASLGCHNFGFADEDGTNGPGQRIWRYFHDGIFNKKIHFLGMMNAYSKESVADIILNYDLNDGPYYEAITNSAYEINLLGDPALSVWTATPTILEPGYDTVLTAPVFTVQLPPYSWVALLANDSIICTQLTDSSGNCVINDQVLNTYMTENPQGLLKVNIKAHNYLPFQGNLHINYGTAITLLSPNGGELWGRGNTYNIDWRENIGVNIKIELLKGGAFHSIITNSTSNTPPYGWTIPDTVSIGSDYRTKATSNDSQAIEDESNGDFAIAAPTLTLVSPNGGEILYIDSSTNITWNSIVTPGDVKILYTTDGGSNWFTVITSTENDGAHPWTVPNVISSNCKIQISEASDGDPVDESDAIFSIEPAPAVTVTSPNGGEIIVIGTPHNITWSHIGTVGNVKIEYSTDNGSTLATVVSSTANDGLHLWTVPGIASLNCRIRISEASDGNPFDISDNVFTIEPIPSITVTAPNGGETLYNGNPFNVTWTHEGTVGDVKILYSPDGGTNWYTVISSTPNDGIHAWTVPDLIVNNCKVKISEAVDDDPVDESDSVFSIVPQPTITVTSPNGGEILYVNTLRDITWAATGTVGNIKIEYSADNGANWATVEENTANDGLHSWTVPITVSSLCKIRVSEAADGDPFDESDNVFTIEDTTDIEEDPNNNLQSLIKYFTAIPNPVSRGQSVTFCFTPTDNIESVKLKVYDPVGNLVFEDCKDKLPGFRAKDQYKLATWNLRNISGRAVAGGTYLAILIIRDKDYKTVVVKRILGIKDNL